jgi:hypothetical protein
VADGPIARIVSGKGAHYELCVLDFNIDIESGICSVTLNKSGSSNKDKACDYCYAKYLYRNNSYRPKEIRESEFKRIATQYPAHILRLGKNVECGHLRTRPQLYQVLEYCVKYKMRPVVTSKVLEFDRKVADLVTAANGVVHLSLGRDEDESGAVAQGATNSWRLSQAVKYKRYGCPTQVRIVADVTLPMNALHKRALKVMGGSRGILLTPLHYTNKSHFESMRKDITWDEAKSTELYSYVKGDLRPNRIHSDWDATKERCGVVAGREYCNNCVGAINFNKKEYKQKLQELGWSPSSE